MFDSTSTKLSEEELKTEEMLTLSAFREYLPLVLQDVIGDHEYNTSTKLLFRSLQHPLLNKQLAFTLIEILLVKIFPELSL